MREDKQDWTCNAFVVLAEGDFASVRRECETEEEAAALVKSLQRFGFLCSVVVKASRVL